LIPASLSDPLFRFDEEKHLYWYGDRPLQSATNLLKKYAPKFDSDTISQKKASERGVPVEVVLEEWKKAKEDGARLGTEVHNAIETWLRGGVVQGLTVEAEKRFSLFRRLMATRLNGAKLLATELKLFSLKYGLAGTCDVLLQLKDGKIMMGDWKTNKRFDTGDKGWDLLKPPFDHLKANELNTYGIQVALYRIMLEEHGLEVYGSFIAHLGPNSREPGVYFPRDLRRLMLTQLRDAKSRGQRP